MLVVGDRFPMRCIQGLVLMLVVLKEREVELRRMLTIVAMTV